jgi:hypothetical protein
LFTLQEIQATLDEQSDYLNLKKSVQEIINGTIATCKLRVEGKKLKEERLRDDGRENSDIFMRTPPLKISMSANTKTTEDSYT